MARHKVGTTADFDGDGSRIITEIRGREIAVFRIDGAYHALANFCAHQSGPLCEGELTGLLTSGENGRGWEYIDKEHYIKCPWHNWRYDVATGKHVNSNRFRIPIYDVTVDDDEVYVEL